MESEIAVFIARAIFGNHWSHAACSSWQNCAIVVLTVRLTLSVGFSRGVYGAASRCLTAVRWASLEVLTGKLQPVTGGNFSRCTELTKDVLSKGVYQLGCGTNSTHLAKWSANTKSILPPSSAVVALVAQTVDHGSVGRAVNISSASFSWAGL